MGDEKGFINQRLCSLLHSADLIFSDAPNRVSAARIALHDIAHRKFRCFLQPHNLTGSLTVSEKALLNDLRAQLEVDGFENATMPANATILNSGARVTAAR
jgi:hypothetical protein